MMNSQYRFWHNTLRNPRFICAPMVWQSEAAFRQLVADHGVHLAYTPMYNANMLLKGYHDWDPIMQDLQTYMLPVNKSDVIPSVIVQFCATDPDALLQAAKKVGSLFMNLYMYVCMYSRSL